MYVFVCMLGRMQEAMATKSRMSEPKEDEESIPMQRKLGFECQSLSRVRRASPFRRGRSLWGVRGVTNTEKEKIRKKPCDVDLE